MGGPLSPCCPADTLSQGWGCTDYAFEWIRPECPGGHFHAGLDLSWLADAWAHLGDPVFALRAGRVVEIGPVYPANGAQYLGPLAPCIQDAEGHFWEYGHVQACHVGIGDWVGAGQRIADIGTLGASTGPHLHLEKRTDGPIQGPPWAAVLDPSAEAFTPLPQPIPPPEVRTRMILIEESCWLPYDPLHPLLLTAQFADAHGQVIWYSSEGKVTGSQRFDLIGNQPSVRGPQSTALPKAPEGTATIGIELDAGSPPVGLYLS